MKKFIALVLSLVMALSLCAPAWAAGEVVVADTAALQDALYNAADGTTIQLKAGVNYGTVVFGQNADSKVVDITDMGGDAAGNEHYSKYENITILGAEGATVDQIDFKVGWIDGHEGASYVDIKNLTVQGVTFSGEKTAFNMEGSKGGGLGIDGLNIIGCKMNDADGDDRFVFQQITGYKEQSDKTTNEYVMTTGVKNLTITGCVVEGAYQVIESRAMENLTITNNTFKGIKARDMLITSDVTNHPNATYTGMITITGNTSIGGEERFVRASLNNSDATLIIKDNTINNYMGEDDDYIKVDGIADGNTKVTIANNTLVTVAKVLDMEYTTLQEALNVGGTVELLGDIILAAPVTVTKDAVLDLKGFGITSTDTTSGVPIYVSSGKLTVRNGELALDGKETTIHGTYNCAIGYEPGTELVVDEVTFTGVTGINGTWKADGAVKISVSNSTFAVSSVGVVVAAGSKEAVATITNCTIDADRYAIFGSQGAQITVNGGDYTSNVAIYSQDAGTVVTVEGGTFTGALSESNNGKIVIKGGTFSVDPTPYVADGYYVTEADDKYVVHQIVATVGTVNYDTLQAAVDAVDDKGTISVVVAGKSAVVNEAKTFTVTGEAATIKAGEGYKVLQDGNTYTVKKTYNVTFDANGGTNEYTLAPVVEGKLVLPANPFKAPEGKQFKAWSVGGKEYAVGAEIDVAADVTVVAVWEYLPAVTDDPEVDVIDPVVSTGDKVNTNDATVNNVVTTITSGVDIDHGAITEAAEEAAEENKVAPTKEQAKELNKLPGISGTTVNDVAIVVQTYYDVAIEEVKVENNKTSSITVDITPMQQTVATTDDVIENKDDIKVGENAVKVGDPVPVKITEPVEITLKLPSSCFEVGQKVYITHKASAGTVIYEATVAADYTITFKTTHGFSPFTISTTAADVKASVGTDNYADLQSAVNYMGKDATVTVKAKDQSAVVDFATTFTVKYENGATKDNTKITAAPGYYLTMKDVADGVQYTVSRAYGWGGGYVGGSSSTTPEKVVTSADTFDAGIALYVGMSVMAAAGSAVVLKKRED